MTRRPSIFLLAVMLMLAFTAPVFAQKPVKIGVLTPLSPPGDTGAGQLILRGAKMAAKRPPTFDSARLSAPVLLALV